ncbi:14090_t:CDS:2, partial [Gigaspora margarita]
QAFNGNVGAPVHEKLQSGAKVAAEYPNTEFYAIDSFPLPDSIDNISFIEYETIKKILFPDNEFDYT